eukprot:12516210-Ditylum_brightwellii.AAC.1
MLVIANLPKHYKRINVERGSSVGPPSVPFIPKATTFKTDNTQEFNLRVTPVSYTHLRAHETLRHH